jgi:hypothetical protein
MTSKEARAMSGKNNVNPDHYKVAGRDRPNEVLPPGNKEMYSEDRARLDEQKGTRIPGKREARPREDND